jgi:hypothetical protein
MREIDELYADSGEPVKESRGVSRGTALKVGGLGLAGALAAFLPGRAGASVRRAASNATCQNGFNCFGPYGPIKCGTDSCSVDGSCYCFSIAYRLHKVGQPNGACGANVFCDTIGTCHYEGDCPPGSFCSRSTCCIANVCVPYCGFGCDFAPTRSSSKTGKTLIHK